MSDLRVGCVCNFYQEANTLPSFFSPAEAMFDELVFVHAPPSPEAGSTDESVELVQRSGHKLIHDTVADGFGVLRSRCISYSSCDWVVILDADERMWASLPGLEPIGSEKWPIHENPQNSVRVTGEVIDQRALLRDMIRRADNEGILALCLSRRHFMGAPGSWAQPCQNWRHEHDWQLRVIKNSPYVCYDPEVKLHERLVDTRTWEDPRFLRGSLIEGPFMDHYSQWAKSMEPSQNAEDAAIYESLDPGSVKNMWLNHQPGVKE